MVFAPMKKGLRVRRQDGRFKIRKDDQVVITTGKEKGKTGKVARVIPKTGKVLVEGLNIIKKHMRPSSQHRQGGIIDIEVPISISNVMLICGKCKGPVRIGRKSLEDGKKVRFCKKCGEVMDK